MISWVVMLVSRLLDYVANIEDEPSGGKKHLVGKERERALTGISDISDCLIKHFISSEFLCDSKNPSKPLSPLETVF